MTIDELDKTGRATAERAARATGLWLNGARGSVATTAITGLQALKAGLVRPIGCVTECPPLAGAPFAPWSDIVVGGHDIVDTPIEKRAELLVDSGVIPPAVLSAVRGSLAQVESDLRPGYDPASQAGSQASAADRLAADIADFRARHGLARVVVVNVASTEPPFPAGPEHHDLATLLAAIAEPGRAVLAPSSVVALAAFQAGAAFIDFTPSTGARLPALRSLAERRGLPYAGSDGKTGETLLRTVLAPMFTSRALHVLSWAGVNLLGGGDGATLENPVNAASKLQSKAGVLPALLGEDVPAPLHIDNVPDLGDRKTAWDHVSFEGFLGARMSMQLTWCGVDSALAAPLVLDLTRLLAAAHERGLSGPVEEMGFFFKDPIGNRSHALADQARALADWVAAL